MRGFPLRGRCLLAVLVLGTVWARPAAASTLSLGQTAPAGAPATCITCTAFQQTTAGSSPSYAVPAGGGTITSWSIQGSPTALDCAVVECVARLRVLRPDGAGAYTLAAESAQQTVAPGSLNTFPVSIPVQADDVLGIEGSQVPFSAAADPGNVLGTVTGLPIVGDLIGGSGGLPITLTPGQLLDVSVTLDVGDPSSSPPGSGGGTPATPGQQAHARFPGVRLPRRTLKVGPSGRTRIPVMCPAAADGSCTGSLALRTVHAITVAGARLKLASARFAVPTGRTRSVLVRISRGGRRVLARRHRLAARLTATARDHSGAVKSTSRTLSVRRR